MRQRVNAKKKRKTRKKQREEDEEKEQRDKIMILATYFVCLVSSLVLQFEVVLLSHCGDTP